MASIETRENHKGTSYRVVWYDPAGKKRSKTWPSRDRADLWKNLIETVNGDTTEALNALARQASTKLTVDKVAQHRLGLIRATPYTLQTYRAYMRNHISPAFGDWPVDTVTEDDCRRFIINLEKKGLSPKYIRNIAGWVTSIMHHAEEREWRTGNPMRPEMIPEVTRTDVQEVDMFLTRDEAIAIIQRMPTRYQLPAMLILATGLRPSEMRALKVSDVSFDGIQPVLRVTKSMKQNAETGEYPGAPKSRQGVRSLGVPGSMRDALAAHVKDRPTTEYLFPGAVNEWMSHKAFAEAFSRGVSLARQDEVLAKSPSPYSLRHTHASLMIANGMEIYALSRHMGHASVTMTEKAYLHLYPDAIYRAATVAEAALGQIPETPVLAVSAG